MSAGTIPLPPQQPGTRRLLPTPFLLAALFPLGLLLAGCGNDTAGTETADPDTATVAAPAKAMPLSVNVFLELSGGMRGFMPVNPTNATPTAFQRRVSQLAARTHSSSAVDKAQFWLSLNEKNVSSSYADFLNVLQGQTQQAALGTELPTMLANILATPGAAQQVNVVVSDFIYGPKNPAAAALMDVNITGALAAVQKQQLAVAVLAETSAFSGTYHPAVKKPRESVSLKGATLPYYIWVIGPPAAVGRYLNEVLPAAAAKTQQAYFGLRFPKIPYVAVLTQVPTASPLAQSSDGSGTISYAGAGESKNLDVSDVTDGIDFTVALNLNQLPAAWREPAFLNQHLKATLPGGAVRLLPNSVQRAAGVTGLAAYTHTLRLHLTALPSADGQLTLSLPAPGIPTWVTQWSTENDNQPGPKPQTYRLTEIMGGLREAFPQPLPPVFTATFSLSNDN